MLKQFKNFLSQRNTIDMAVGIIIGSAMSNITKSFTNNLINPLIGLFFGKINFSDLSFTVGRAVFKVGSFINSLISFLIIALIVFIIARAINKMTNYQNNKSATDTQLLTDIRDLLAQQQHGGEASAKQSSDDSNDTKDSKHPLEDPYTMTKKQLQKYLKKIRNLYRRRKSHRHSNTGK